MGEAFHFVAKMNYRTALKASRHMLQIKFVSSCPATNISGGGTTGSGKSCGFLEDFFLAEEKGKLASAELFPVLILLNKLPPEF